MAALSLVFDLIGKDNASKSFRDVGDAADKTGRNLRDVGDQADKAGRKGEGFGSSMSGAMKVAGGAILASGIISGFKGLYEAAAESAKISALTENAIRSTGGAAKLSASQVGDLVTAISNKTGVDDEAIQSGANLLLTFTNIRNEQGKGNDVFTQTTQIMTDMAAALGTDASGSAIQLGKALNDPVKGVSALTKVGVSFTEQQKDQIKTLVASGDTLGAQKVILAELNKEFGGAAAAAATPLDKLKVNIGNIQEALGAKLIPIISSASSFIVDKMLPAFSSVGDVVGSVTAILFKGDFTGGPFQEDGFLVDVLFKIHDAFVVVADFVKANLAPILGGLGGVVAVLAGPVVFGGLATVIGAVGTALGFLVSPVGLTVIAIGGMVAIFVKAYQESEPLRLGVAKLKEAFELFFDAFKSGNDAAGISGFFDGIKAGIDAAWPKIQSALGDIGTALWSWILDAIGPAVENLGGWLAAVINWFYTSAYPTVVKAWSSLASAYVGWIAESIGPALASLGEWLGALLGWLWDTALPWLGNALSGLGQALVDWIGPRIPELFKKLGEFLGSAVGWIIGTGIPMLIGGLLFLAYELVTWVLPQLPGLLVNFGKLIAGVVAWLVTTGLPTLATGLFNLAWEAIKSFWSALEQSPLFAKLGEIFGGAVDIVKKKWDELKEKVKEPIRIVFDWVNGNMIDPINGLLKNFPGNLQIAPLPELATGGHVRGPGTGTSDSIPAMLSNGEYVIRASTVRALGVGALDDLNAGRRALYARGGLVEAGGPWDVIKNAAGAVKDFGADILAKGARAVAGAVLEPLRTAAKALVPGGNVMGDVLRGTIDKLVDGVLGKGDDADKTGGALGNGAVGGGGWQKLWALVHAAFPTARRTSDYRPGDPGYHGKGLAVDVAGARPGDAAAMLAIDRWAAANYGGSLAELIHTPGINLLNGKPHTYNAATRADHYDHVHMAMRGFAGGGYINGPGGPQSDSIIAALSNGEYVLNAASVQKYGLGVMNALNSGSASIADAGDSRQFIHDMVDALGASNSDFLDDLSGALSNSSAEFLADLSAMLTSSTSELLPKLTDAVAEGMRSAIAAMPSPSVGSSDSDSHAGMVQAEDGGWVPASYYADDHVGMVQAEDGGWVPKSYYADQNLTAADNPFSNYREVSDPNNPFSNYRDVTPARSLTVTVNSPAADVIAQAVIEAQRTQEFLHG